MGRNKSRTSGRVLVEIPRPDGAEQKVNTSPEGACDIFATV